MSKSSKRERLRARKRRQAEARAEKRHAAAQSPRAARSAADPIRGGERFEVGLTREWYIARLAPRMTDKALKAMKDQAVAVFQPRATRVATVRGRRVVRSAQLLLRRVFVGLPETVPLATVRAMPGVMDIISRVDLDEEAGGNVAELTSKPIRLDPVALQRFVDAVTRDEVVQPYGVSAGSNVIVRHGPFSGFPGVVEDILANDRFKVAVAIFGRATPVELTIEQFELVA